MKQNKVGRPPLGKQDSKTLHLTLPGEVYNQIEQLAAADQRSVVGMTRVLILKGLKHAKHVKEGLYEKTGYCDDWKPKPEGGHENE